MIKCSFLTVLVRRTSTFTQCRIAAKWFEREQRYGKKCDLQKPPVAVIIDFGKSRRINDPNIYCSVKCNPEPRHRWIAPEIFYGAGCQTVQSDIVSLGELTRFAAKTRSIDNLKSVIDKCTNKRPRHKRDLSAVRKFLKEGMYMWSNETVARWLERSKF